MDLFNNLVRNLFHFFSLNIVFNVRVLLIKIGLEDTILFVVRILQLS
jgi:hypothetical protein